jgi:hypothetical protein
MYMSTNRDSVCMEAEINKEIDSYAKDTNEENLPGCVCMVVA